MKGYKSVYAPLLTTSQSNYPNITSFEQFAKFSNILQVICHDSGKEINMENLSSTCARSEQIEKHVKKERRGKFALEDDQRYYYEGEAVSLVGSYSSQGKRIAIIEDSTGETQEVYFDQLN
ncbi:hypothetical protein [Sulfurimonas diazotrophicus]|uniref:Uncharacterized protein n=1 Tax=Sulfurimonas diazotrophicus TaxID=3131939 RepID=A0ABZ3HC94_9BACT